MSDDRATVERLLAAAGITPSAEELDTFVAMYPVLREQAERPLPPRRLPVIR